MAIYAVTIKGRNRRVLVRESSAAKAIGHLVEAKALTAEQMQDALDSGEGVWKPDQELPADEDEATPAGDPPSTGDKGAAE